MPVLYGSNFTKVREAKGLILTQTMICFFLYLTSHSGTETLLMKMKLVV